MDDATLLDLYRDMWTIRSFELGLEREFEQGNVPGMLHTGLGQEAVQAALAAHLQATDCFFPRPSLSRHQRAGPATTRRRWRTHHGRAVR